MSKGGGEGEVVVAAAAAAARENLNDILLADLGTRQGRACIRGRQKIAKPRAINATFSFIQSRLVWYM